MPAGDIMVLVRHRREFVDHLVRALKQRSVGVAGIDRLVLSTQLAVMDLLALAEAALMIDDDLTVAAVLKGPLAGLDEAALFDLAHGRGETSRAAALALRCAGVWGGAVFIRPQQANLEEFGKRRIVAANAGDTRVTRLYSGKTMRNITNE